MSRGRPALIERPTALNLSLPATERAKLDLLLYSELEQRIPKGAYQQFFLARLREFFSGREFDLAPYLGTLPGERTVRGSPETIASLEATLAKGDRNGS
jgi:hypothetical protein